MEQGITLVEILLVIFLIVFLALLIFPVGISFYKSQQLESHTQGILQTLRLAQGKAMGVESDSSFGVYLTHQSYILFQGASFAARNLQYDEVFDLPQGITVQDSPKEIVFSKSEGKPNVIENIILNSDNLTQVISINEVGRINLE